MDGNREKEEDREKELTSKKDWAGNRKIVGKVRKTGSRN